MTLSIKDISEVTGKSQKTIRRALAAGELKGEKTNNRWHIDKEEVRIWLENKPEDYLEGHLFSNLEESSVDPQPTKWVDIKDLWDINYWDNDTDSNGMNFVDLFSGAGGLSLGFTMAGFKPIASVEIMDAATETYEYNFHLKRGFEGYIESRDIREKSVKEDLYREVAGKKVDVVIGGFPCQGFSMAGNRIVTDERNTLYLDMLEIVKELKPEFVVMENVEGLRSMLDGKIEQKIIEDYKKIGYNISVETLNSANYKVAQLRKRVIFIANRIGVENLHPKPLVSPDEYVTLGEAIKDLMRRKDNAKINHVTTKHSEEMKKRLSDVKSGKSLYGNYSDAWKKSPWDKPSCTIKENHGGVNIHPKLPRVITAREMARLQSFPDDFIFKGSKKWQLVQIGNAVPPLMAKAIGLAICKMKSGN